MLVENGTKVQKLYGSTVDAERATQEVERQLASVEGQQEELSSWLDRYEREVDEMMSKQVGPGETLQGPDQERERTYKLAEKLSERLDEMGKDLSSMIEEVNGASATLSKTSKADEPVSSFLFFSMLLKNVSLIGSRSLKSCASSTRTSRSYSSSTRARRSCRARSVLRRNKARRSRRGSDMDLAVLLVVGVRRMISTDRTWDGGNLHACAVGVYAFLGGFFYRLPVNRIRSSRNNV